MGDLCEWVTRKCEAYCEIQHESLKRRLVNLICKTGIVFFFQFTSWFNLQASDYDVIVDFHVNSTSLTRHSFR